MSSTYTTSLGLRKPSHADPDTVNSWDTVINTNMDYIDAAYGPRVYSGVSPNGHYILASDNHSLSLDKLDVALYTVSINTPTAPEKAALAGMGTPTVSNKYTTYDYVRVNRKKQIFPEYAGGTFTPAPGGANIGVMTTNAEMIANYMYNYYKWLSTEVALQSYDISLQWRVPETFINWLTKALSVDICTELTDPLECKVSVYVYKDGVALGPVSSLDKVSTVAATWYDERHNSDVITFSDTQLGSTLNLGAGDVIDVLIRVYSRNSRYVKVGAVTLGYRG